MRDKKITDVAEALKFKGFSAEEVELAASELESGLAAFDALVYVLLNGTSEQRFDTIQKVAESDNAIALAGLVLAGASRYCELVMATKVAAEKPVRTDPDESARFA